MAQISMGIGSSHGPLLSLKPEDWDVRTKADRAHPGHPFQGGTYKFDELLELRRDDYLIAQNKLEARQAAFDRCQIQLDALADKLAEAAPDVLVVMGDDHKEWYLDNALPAISIFCGDHMINRVADPEKVGSDTVQLDYMKKERFGSTDTTFPCDDELAHHLIHTLIDDEFDISSSSKIPLSSDGGPKSMGHAFAFIYRRLLRDKPIPLVPIVLNTYFPPTQPSPKRCWDFGQAVGRAIESWDSDKKVCVVASGGLSHFAIDEEFDRRMLDAMKAGDMAAMINEPNELFQSGTSETKNWIVTAASMAQAGHEMDLLDYVPCYRSEAGTGNAMGFAIWQ